jgi:hypothetical protein
MARSFYFQIRPLLHDCDVQILFGDTGDNLTQTNLTYPNLTFVIIFPDSFFLKVTSKTKKIDHLARLSPIMDFSNYPKSHPKYNNANAACLGYFKDELAGKDVIDYAGLRSKSYAYNIDDNTSPELHSRCKGIKKPYKKNLTFAMYKRCIDEISEEAVTFYNMRSSNHKISTQKITKRALGSFDDKRLLLCGKHSVPYGSKLYSKFKKTHKCPFCWRK